MRNFFYFRLALDNFKKNARMQIPFLLSSALTVMIFYLVFSLSTNEGIGGLMGGNYVQQLLGFGIGVIIVFSIIFLFYTYSFLIKRRKREFLRGKIAAVVVKIRIIEHKNRAAGCIPAGLLHLFFVPVF